MLSIISLICMALGYFLFIFTESMMGFSVFLIIAATVISLIDLISLYKKEKLDFNDFVTQAFATNWGSMISVIGGISFAFIFIF